jgi:membrane protease YdiL (CAAX protease family)
MTQQYMINTRRRISPWLFFGLTYGLSWLLWILAALSGQDVTRPPWAIAYVLGATTPSIMGIILTYVSEDREGRRDFWRRTFDLRRIRPGTYALIVLVFPLVYGTAILVDRLTGGSGAEFAALRPLNLLALIGTPVMMLLNGFVEELGWRGFALDRLQLRRSALSAGILLGLIHALWHTPLFLTRGTLQYEWGLFSQYYWMFMLNTILGSIIHTWLYNNNHRSILTAILFHAAHNLTLSLIMPVSSTLLIYAAVLNAIIVLGLVRIYGAKTLHS